MCLTFITLVFALRQWQNLYRRDELTKKDINADIISEEKA